MIDTAQEINTKTDNKRERWRRVLGRLYVDGVDAVRPLPIARIFCGRFEDGLDPLERSLRLSPFDPLASVFTSLIALAHYHLGNYDDALQYSERALQRRRIIPVLRTQAATLGQLGRPEEARLVLEEMEGKMPINRERHWELTNPYADPTHEAHLLEGLQKAGSQEATTRADALRLLSANSFNRA